MCHAAEQVGWVPRWVRDGYDPGPLTSTDVVEMRCWNRIKYRETAWGYTEKQKKEQYIRVAIKKLQEEDPEFEFYGPWHQLDLIVERAKQIAVDQANDENEFVAQDAEGNVLDEEGKPDPDAKRPDRPNTFMDGSAGAVGETRERGKAAGIARPKTFNRG